MQHNIDDKRRSTRTASSGGGDNNEATSTSMPPRMSLHDVLREVQAYVTHPVLIGVLFRQLSPAARRTLSAMRLPLEQLLLHYPDLVTVYRGSLRMQRGNIYVCLPDKAPPTCLRIRLPPGHTMGVNALTGERLPELRPTTSSSSSNNNSNSSSSSSSHRRCHGPDECDGGESDGGEEAVAVARQTGDNAGNNARALDDVDERAREGDFVARAMTLQERVQEVLLYVPNTWTDFVQLRIPPHVKTRCMQYPNVKPMHFFEKHAQYFDVRKQAAGRHTFEVRRSLALQERVRMHTRDDADD